MDGSSTDMIFPSEVIAAVLGDSKLVSLLIFPSGDVKLKPGISVVSIFIVVSAGGDVSVVVLDVIDSFSSSASETFL